MQKKSILMPHTCHKVGWWLLLLIPLVWGFYEILYHFFHETNLFTVVNDNSRFITMVFYLLVASSAFLICLSKEKVEDEMVSQYRLKAIGIAAYVHYILFLSLLSYNAVADGFVINFGYPWENLYYFSHYLPFTTAGLYYLIFKWMLWRSRKEEAL